MGGWVSLHCYQVSGNCLWMGFSVSKLVRDVPSVLKYLVAVSGWISCVAACVVSTCVLDVPSVLKLWWCQGRYPVLVHFYMMYPVYSNFWWLVHVHLMYPVY